MQFEKMILFLLLSLSLLNVCYAKLLHVDLWGNYIIETQRNFIERRISLISLRDKEKFRWIDDELTKIENEFVCKMVRISQSSRNDDKLLVLQLKIVNPLFFSFMEQDVEKVSDILFYTNDHITSLVETVKLVNQCCYIEPPATYAVAKYIKEEFVQSMNLKEFDNVFQQEEELEQKELERILCRVECLKLKADNGNLNAKKFLSNHLKRYSFGFCQMLVNKLKKKSVKLRLDNYQVLPCNACSFLLSNIDYVYNEITNSREGERVFFKQWLVKWMRDISNADL